MSEPLATEDPSRARAGRLFRGLGISLAALAAALALLELLGLFVPALSADALDPERRLIEGARVEPHPYLAYVNKPGFEDDRRAQGGHQISHNSMGFRGPETTWEKPEGVYRIACLGGSSTYGHGPSSDATTWPAQLQAMLSEAAPGRPVEVINAGCQGYSTFESLANLAYRVLDLEPDLVIVYHGINDMRCALWTRPARDNVHWRAIWPVERASAVDRLLGRSTTFRLLRSLDPVWRSRRSGDLGWYAIVGYRAEDWALTPASELGFASVRRNLESLVALAASRGAGTILGLQAMRWSDLERFGTGADQETGLRRVLELVREVGDERGAPVVDVAAALEGEAARRLAAGAQDDGLFTSEVHVTDEGAALIARTFADAILELGLVR